MDLFSYCYNVVFVLFYAVTLSACFTAYGVTKQKHFRWFGILMLVYLFESVFIAIFSVVHKQGVFHVTYFLGISVFTGIEIYVFGKAIYTIFSWENSRGPLYLSLAAVCCSVCCVVIGHQFGWFLDISIFSSFVFILCGIYGHFLKKTQGTATYESARKWRWILMVIGLFSALSVLENVLYLCVVHEWLDRVLPVYKNHITVFGDLLSMILSIWLSLFSQKELDTYIAQNIEETLQERMDEFQAREQERKKQVSEAQIVEFGSFYGLTEREIEILRLILEGKSNQEISQFLHITIGTVKTHIHNIFGKLEVSRRGQLMTRFVHHGIQ